MHLKELTLIIFLYLSVHSSKHFTFSTSSFSEDGFTLVSPKSAEESSYSDVLLSSPNLISLVTGMGKLTTHDFNISKYMTIETLLIGNKYLQEERLPEMDEFINDLIQSIRAYNQQTTALVHQKAPESKLKEINGIHKLLESLHESFKFSLGLLNTKENNTPELQLYQYGDSRITAFKQMDLKGKRHVFMPKFQTLDTQKNSAYPTEIPGNLYSDTELWNQSHNYNNADPEMVPYYIKHMLKKHLRQYTLPIEETDLLMFASAGIYDLFNLPVLTILLNYYIYLVSNDTDINELQTISDYLANDLIKMYKEQSQKVFGWTAFTEMNMRSSLNEINKPKENPFNDFTEEKAKFKRLQRIVLNNKKQEAVQDSKFNMLSSLFSQSCFSANLPAPNYIKVGIGSKSLPWTKTDVFRDNLAASASSTIMSDIESNGITTQQRMRVMSLGQNALQNDQSIEDKGINYQPKNQINLQNIFSENCDISDFILFYADNSKSTNKNPIPRCVFDIIYHLNFDKHALKNFNMRSFEKWLVYIASKVQSVKTSVAVPSYLKALVFGQDKPHTIQKDISITVTKIKEKQKGLRLDQVDEWVARARQDIEASRENLVEIYFQSLKLLI